MIVAAVVDAPAVVVAFITFKDIPEAACDLLLTPDNARRLAERLAEMRGAAMKICMNCSIGG